MYVYLTEFSVLWIANEHLFSTVMEVAVGEYEIDMSKMVHAASKKYYEDRDHYSLMIEQQVEKLNGKKLF